MSSPPQHAAPSTLANATSTAHSPSPKERTRATPSPPPPPQKKPKQKRARVTVDPDETTQVTGQDRYKLQLADADAYYIPDFVDPLIAQHWHDELLKLEECEPWPPRALFKRGGNSLLNSTPALAFFVAAAALNGSKQGTNRLSKSTANP